MEINKKVMSITPDVSSIDRSKLEDPSTILAWDIAMIETGYLRTVKAVFHACLSSVILICLSLLLAYYIQSANEARAIYIPLVIIQIVGLLGIIISLCNLAFYKIKIYNPEYEKLWLRLAELYKQQEEEEAIKVEDKKNGI